MKPIGVLGRGYSLGKYKKYNHLFDKIYITARFTKEIRELGKKRFKGKEIVHVAARGSPSLKPFFYRQLNIKYVQTACYSVEKEFRSAKGTSYVKLYPTDIEIKPIPKCMEKRGYSPLPADIIEPYCKEFDFYKDLSCFLEKTMAKEIKESDRRTRYWPTTGIFALDLALMENKVKKIYLFGLDLYTTLTYKLYGDREFFTPIDTSRTRLAFYHLKQLVKEFPKVKFYSLSKSEKFKFNLPNWKILK